MFGPQSSKSINEVLDTLENTPAEVEKLMHGLSDAELTFQSSPEEFSVTQHVCHLRDIDTEGYSVRIRRMLAEENPRLEDVDGARLAAERDYNSENIALAEQAFREIRRQSVATLRGLDDRQLNRTGVLQGVGQITLRQLASLMEEHDAGHLEELRVLRQRLLRTQSS